MSKPKAATLKEKIKRISLEVNMARMWERVAALENALPPDLARSIDALMNAQTRTFQRLDALEKEKHAAPKVERYEVRDLGSTQTYVVVDKQGIHGWVSFGSAEKRAREYCNWLNSRTT